MIKIISLLKCQICRRIVYFSYFILHHYASFHTIIFVREFLTKISTDDYEWLFYVFKFKLSFCGKHIVSIETMSLKTHGYTQVREASWSHKTHGESSNNGHKRTQNVEFWPFNEWRNVTIVMAEPIITYFTFPSLASPLALLNSLLCIHVFILHDWNQ